MSSMLIRKGCPMLRVLGATLSTTENHVGATVEIRCDKLNSRLDMGLPRTKTMCTNSGKWTYFPSNCTENRCGPFHWLENGNLVEYNNTVGGFTVITCHLSYGFPDRTKTKKFQCLDNLVWELPPRCFYNTCESLRKPRLGKLNTTIVLENTVVKIKCLPGHMFPDRKRTKIITCNSTFKWSDEVEDCQAIRCMEPPIITHSNMTSREVRYKSSITYTCDEGYRMEDGHIQHTIKCGEDAMWTNVQLSCDLGRCPPVPEVINATYDTSLAVNGTIVTYTCNKGYGFSNNNSVMYVSCNGEDWNITESACSEGSCPELNLTHASWSYNGTNVGAKVMFTCDEGYQYENGTAGFLECQANATWSGNDTGCQHITCGPAPNVKYSIKNNSIDNFPKTRINYCCIEGFWFRRGVNETTIFCNGHGVWSHIPSKCKRIICQVIPKWNDKKANTTQRKVGTILSLIKTKGGDKGATIMISECMPNGEWKPSLDNNGIYKKPDPVEAESSAEIGIVFVSTIGVIIAVIVFCDVRKVMEHMKIIKQKRKRRRPRKPKGKKFQVAK